MFKGITAATLVLSFLCIGAMAMAADAFDFSAEDGRPPSSPPFWMLLNMRTIAPLPSRASNSGATPIPPEQKYESLLSAPLWRPSGNATLASVDLRSRLSPPKDQGRRYMCNSFAAIGLAEFLAYKEGNPLPLFSEEFVYYDTKYNHTGNPALLAYREPYSGLAGYMAVVALKDGVVAAEDWPFKPVWKNPQPKPPVKDPDVGEPPRGLAGKVIPFNFSPVAIRRSEIKEYIATQRKPVLLNIMFYNNITGDFTGKKISMPTKEEHDRCFTSNDNCFGHVALLVGYDAATDELIMRNSWGTEWGDNGNVRFPAKYVDEECEACPYASTIGSHSVDSDRVTENALYGWSGSLR